MISMACVHGVNTSLFMDYVSSWQEALALPSKGEAVRWPSTDNPVFDWFGIRFHKDFRVHAVNYVKRGLWRWYMRTAEEKTVVVAHSMGVPLAMRALTELGINVPFVGVGSPLTHPLLGPRLERIGFGELASQTPTVFSNREDFICSLKVPLLPKFIWRQPKYLKRVSVNISAQPHREHDAEKYLALDEVREHVLEVAR